MNYFESIYAAGLPNRAISVYFYLVQRANSDGKCWPSERKIAMDLSMSRSTVKRALDDLTRTGFIKVEQRYRQSGAKSSLLFTIPDFEKYRRTKG